ncbi:MAG: diaminopimelate epimerase [Candidatus Coatesbacteria bacterium]|nr:diaminopimelate epimerase [Candidatus Coatesbacteria bacterium]
MTRLEFTKMHGLGNDYVLFDMTEDHVDGLDLSALSKKVCAPHFSIGGDGTIFLKPGDSDTDFVARIFNPDGSETGACGTAFRCIARYAYERKGMAKALNSGVSIRTFARTVTAKLLHDSDGGLVGEAMMGKALFKRRDIPVKGDAESHFLEETLEVGEERFVVSAASVGNPHAILFCEDLSRVPIDRIGPAIESHPAFPERTNVHFVRLVSRRELEVWPYERGTGRTLSCGTGASAVVAIANRLGKVDPPVRVSMPGGSLEIDIQKDGDIIMRAKTEFAFSGWIEYET